MTSHSIFEIEKSLMKSSNILSNYMEIRPNLINVFYDREDEDGNQLGVKVDYSPKVVKVVEEKKDVINEEKIISYLEKNRKKITILDNYAIKNAAEDGCLKVVKWLLDNGADPTAEHCRAVCNALQNKHHGIAHYIIAYIITKDKKKYDYYICYKDFIHCILSSNYMDTKTLEYLAGTFGEEWLIKVIKDLGAYTSRQCNKETLSYFIDKGVDLIHLDHIEPLIRYGFTDMAKKAYDGLPEEDKLFVLDTPLEYGKIDLYIYFIGNRVLTKKQYEGCFAAALRSDDLDVIKFIYNPIHEIYGIYEYMSICRGHPNNPNIVAFLLYNFKPTNLNICEIKREIYSVLERCDCSRKIKNMIVKKGLCPYEYRKKKTDYLVDLVIKL